MNAKLSQKIPIIENFLVLSDKLLEKLGGSTPKHNHD